jgi:hypothetical protein
MPMNAAYLNALRTHGASLITHIALVDAGGTELTGGSYARQAVTWATPATGLIRPNADLVFPVPAGAVVAAWRGYSASTGGTSYDGEAVTQRTYTNAGTYELLAASTGIQHAAA